MSSWIGKTGHLCTCFFFSFTTRIAYWCTESSCVARRCTVNKKNPRNKIWKLLMQQIRTVLPIGARCISISLRYTETNSNVRRTSIICLVFPIYKDIAQRLCFTWQKRKYIENKDDSKIKKTCFRWGIFLISLLYLTITAITENMVLNRSYYYYGIAKTWTRNAKLRSGKAVSHRQITYI